MFSVGPYVGAYFPGAGVAGTPPVSARVVTVALTTRAASIDFLLSCDAVETPMQLMDPTYNEGTTVKVLAAFRDDTGAPVTPSEAPEYRVDDVDTGTEIVAWRVIPETLAASMEVRITPAENGAHGNTRRVMRRRVTVRFAYGPGGLLADGGVDEVDYLLKNLTYFPGV